MPHIAKVKLSSISPYSQSRRYDHLVDKLNDKEKPSDYEARTWRHKMHVNEDGNVYIPAQSFKNALSEAAKFLSLQVPGKGKATYTKHFEAGIMVVDPTDLGIKADTVPCDALYVNSKGQRGGTLDVLRHFPRIDQWSATVDFYILDDTVTQEVFVRVLKEAGSLIGIGRWRPRMNGTYGRFRVEDVKWLPLAN